MGLLPMDMDILPPSDDRVFKLILTMEDAKPVLIDLVSAILGRCVVDVEIRNNDMPAGDVDEKMERLDINCKLDDGTQVSIEMQASQIEELITGLHKNLKGKSIFYLCDLHSSQPSKGISYDQLAQTYQVTFCTYTVFPGNQDYVNTFSLRNNKTNEQFSDAINIIFVELSKLQEIVKKPTDDMTDLEKWAIFFRYANDSKHREKMNEVIESKEALQMASELLMSISQDERERAIFRSRRMYQTDLQSNLATAENRGRRLGRQEGLLEGRQEGKIEIARMMLSASESIEKIMSYTGLTKQEIARL